MPRIKDNNKWLHAYMKRTKITRQEVAAILEVDSSTVDRYLLPPPVDGERPTNQYRRMPNMARKLIICQREKESA